MCAALADLVLPWVNDRALRPADALRRTLVASARGRVVEIGYGSGLNAALYGPAVTSLVAVEPSDAMWQRGAVRAAEAGRTVTRIRGFATALPVDAGSVDTVVSTFVLCSVRDVAATLREIQRILRPGGRLLVLEHVASTTPWVTTVQRSVRVPWGALLGGCDPSRDLAASLYGQGLTVSRLARVHLPALPWLVQDLVTAECVRHALAEPSDTGAT